MTKIFLSKNHAEKIHEKKRTKTAKSSLLNNFFCHGKREIVPNENDKILFPIETKKIIFDFYFEKYNGFLPEKKRFFYFFNFFHTFFTLQ